MNKCIISFSLFFRTSYIGLFKGNSTSSFSAKPQAGSTGFGSGSTSTGASGFGGFQTSGSDSGVCFYMGTVKFEDFVHNFDIIC